MRRPLRARASEVTEGVWADLGTLLAMTNPATELAALLQSWTVPQGRAPRQAREAVANELGRSVTEEQARACRHLADIERWIARLELRGINVSGYRANQPRWQEAVFSVHVPYTAAVRSETAALPADPMHSLTALSGAIDLAGGVLELSPESFERAMSAVTSAEKFVQGADGISQSLRLHLLGLLAAIREALGEGAPDRAAPLVAEYIGTVLMTSERVPDGKRAAWREHATDWVTQFSAGVAAGGSLPLLTGVVQTIVTAIGS